MIGSVASYELIKQSRRNVGVQAGDKARPRPYEFGLYAREIESTWAREGIRNDSLPGLMNIANREGVVFGVVVAAPDKFPAPGRRRGAGRRGGGNRRPVPRPVPTPT